MSRNSIIAGVIAIVAIAIVAVVFLNSRLEQNELGAPTDLAAGDEPATPEEDEMAMDAGTDSGETTAAMEGDVPEEIEALSPEQDHEASVAVSEAAREAARTSGRPVQDALDEVRAIVEEANLVSAADETLTPNDEAAENAEAIGAEEALDPEYVENALEPEAFEAERVVALIDASPRLDEEQKAEFRAAVQAAADDPDARGQILAVLEDVLLPGETTEGATQ